MVFEEFMILMFSFIDSDEVTVISSVQPAQDVSDPKSHAVIHPRLEVPAPTRKFAWPLHLERMHLHRSSPHS